MGEERHEGPLGEAIELIESIADPLIVFIVALSVFSFFLNILHLFILTRKSVSSTSTNILLVAIAISDICTLFLTVEKYYTLVDIESNECISSNYLIKVYLDMVVWALQDYFRRCSTWLGLSLAAVRTLIVKSVMSTSGVKISTAKFGKRIAFLVFLLSSIPSIFYYFRFAVIEYRQWPLPLSCEEFQDIYETPKYTLNITNLFERDNQIVGNVYLMVDAVISKFIPCTCFPIFTVILISVLRKATSKTISKKAECSSPTTKLVVFMTIAFFIAELPLGVIHMIRAFNHTHDGLIIASVDVIIVFACLLTVNSTCHFFFCMVISKQYRSTFLGFFGIERIVWHAPGSKSQDNLNTKTARSEASRNQSNVFESGIYLGNVPVQ